jgi:5'-phosphate synthase pdxT subunit
VGRTRVGILAIQGDVAAHARALAGIGAEPLPVRHAEDLAEIEALILPGGESTTIAKGLERLALYEPLGAFAAEGRPILGTCAGAVLLAREVESHPVRSLGLLDVIAVRNAYGTHSKLEDLRCIFIRAPRLRRPGPDVEVLARVDGWPVFVRQGKILATTFHPELSGDPRIHQLLVELTR